MNFLQNFYHDFLYDYSPMLKRLNPKYLYQYLTRGFSDLELHNLDRSLAKIIHKRVKAYAAINCDNYCAMPESYKHFTLWKRDLKKVEFAFEKLADTSQNWLDADKHFKNIKDENDSTTWVKVVQHRRKYIACCLDIFGKNFRSLWL